LSQCLAQGGDSSAASGCAGSRDGGDAAVSASSPSGNVDGNADSPFADGGSVSGANASQQPPLDAYAADLAGCEAGKIGLPDDK
jgi:hypothetical protein